MKKILIDVNSVVPYYVSGRINGIGRTTRELVYAMDNVNDLPFEITLYSQNMKGVGGRNMETQFKSCHVYLPDRSRWNKAMSHFPIREWLTHYDLMHIPHNFAYVHRPDKCVVTVHDAMFFSHPEAFLGHDSARRLYPPFARKCRGVITCSYSSKREIVEYMGVPEERVHVIYWGYDAGLFYPRGRKTNAYCGESPFFLSVSCSQGRKNTIAIIRAFERFAKLDPDHHLILVWKNPSAEALEISNKQHVKGRVHFVNDVSDEVLAQIYSDATATFFPSKYEGFGLPILESMAAGTPVVTCRNSSLKEVGGDAALYVEPDDVGAMTHIMEKFENKSLNYDMLVKCGLDQARRFSWEQTAMDTIEIYKKYLV